MLTSCNNPSDDEEDEESKPEDNEPAGRKNEEGDIDVEEDQSDPSSPDSSPSASSDPVSDDPEAAYRSPTVKKSTKNFRKKMARKNEALRDSSSPHFDIPPSFSPQANDRQFTVKGVKVLPDLAFPDPISTPPSPKDKAGKAILPAAKKIAISRTKTDARGTTLEYAKTLEATKQADEVRLFLEAAHIGRARLDVVYKRVRFQGNYINDRPTLEAMVRLILNDFNDGDGIQASLHPIQTATSRKDFPKDFSFDRDQNGDYPILTLEDYARLLICIINGNHRIEAANRKFEDLKEATTKLREKIEAGKDAWNHESEVMSWSKAKSTLTEMEFTSDKARYFDADIYDKGMINNLWL